MFLQTVPVYLYTASFILTMVGLLCLIIFPRQSWANFWFAGIIAPVLLGILYTFVLVLYFFLPHSGVTSPGGPHVDFGVSTPIDFLSLRGLRNLFLKDGLLLAGFLDLLLMPLAVAAWMARKAAQIRMPYLFLLPCMVLAIAAPGTGLVVYVLLAAVRGRLSQMARFEGQPPTNTSPVFARPTAPRLE